MRRARAFRAPPGYIRACFPDEQGKVCSVVLPCPVIFRLRCRSLLRGIVLALLALAVSLRMAGFPRIDRLHSSAWQILPALATCWALGETVRCFGRRWSFYHAGVLILAWTDLMILTLAIVFCLFP